MSDTPRTEAEVNRPHGPLDGIVTIDADFACQLERELNAANVELEEKRKDIVWLATEKAKSENYVTELENRLRALWDKYDGERQHYMDRIKRLEEAGDVLAQRSAQLGLLPMAIEAWYKAKEAKP